MEHILQAQNTVAKKSESVINARQLQLLKNILLLALLCATYSYFAYPKFMDVGYPQIGYEADTIAVEEVAISVEIPDEESRTPLRRGLSKSAFGRKRPFKNLGLHISE